MFSVIHSLRYPLSPISRPFFHILNPFKNMSSLFSKVEREWNFRKNVGFHVNLSELSLDVVEEGRVRASIKNTNKLQNVQTFGHGGALALLADDVCTLSVLSVAEIPGVTTDFNLSILRPALPNETLTAESQVIKQGGNLFFMEIKIFNEKGKLVVSSRQTKFMGQKPPERESGKTKEAK
eukprot:GCRY01002566.1.p1 GENE.GCRY01002566.1~~GCRY01002566.1.p1  ORF type:complete len:180 (+),score=13.46 GCRY01002566.1:275-814(+)